MLLFLSYLGFGWLTRLSGLDDCHHTQILGCDMTPLGATSFYDGDTGFRDPQPAFVKGLFSSKEW